jgi:hypothetical protein
MAACQFHRDRPGIGVCMRCRRVICAACCTKLDGVNHCHACLRALGQERTPEKTGRMAAWMTAGLLLGVSWLVLCGILWLVQGRLAP